MAPALVTRWTPSELVAHGKASFKAVKFDNAKSNLLFSNLLIDHVRPQIILKGALATENINHSQEYDTYSFGISLDDHKDNEALIEWSEELCSIAERGYETKPVFRNGDTSRLFLKLKKSKDNKKAFNVLSNVDLVPKKKAPIFGGMPLEVVCTVGAYFNTKDKVCGLTFQIRELNFVGYVHPVKENDGKKKKRTPAKRMLTPVDEEDEEEDDE